MRNLGWISLWILVALAVHFVATNWTGRAFLTNDGYQYLDAAGHLLAHRDLATSVAHFDEQIAWGKLPVPLTHFPPGYPIAIAGVSALGFPLITAAYLLSILGFIAVALLIREACRSLDVGPFVIAMLCLLWITNNYALLFSIVLGPGALFVACTTAFAVCILRDLETEGSRPMLLVVMGVAIGCAFSLRYAGLFFIPSIGMYLAWRVWRTPAVWRWALSGAAVVALFMVPILLRNTMITGSWRGGHSNGKSHTISEVAHEFVTAPFHITLGDNAPISVGLWTVLLIAGAFFLAGALVAQLRSVPLRSVWPEHTLATLMWFTIIAGGYAAGIILTELTTIAAATHYYVPIYPFALIVAGMALRLAVSIPARAALAVCVLSILVINARSTVNPRPPAPDSEVSRLMKQDVEPGLPLRSWLQANLKPDSVLFATNGQAVYWVLRRPVVSIIDGGSTSRDWTPDVLRTLMEHYRSRYVMVFPGADHYAVLEQDNIPLFSKLAAGEPLPWLKIATRAPGVIVYECIECRNVSSSLGEVSLASFRFR